MGHLPDPRIAAAVEVEAAAAEEEQQLPLPVHPLPQPPVGRVLMLQEQMGHPNRHPRPLRRQSQVNQHELGEELKKREEQEREGQGEQARPYDFLFLWIWRGLQHPYLPWRQHRDRLIQVS